MPEPTMTAAEFVMFLYINGAVFGVMCLLRWWIVVKRDGRI